MLPTQLVVWSQAITPIVWTFLDSHPTIWNETNWCWSFFVLSSFSPRIYLSHCVRG